MPLMSLLVIAIIIGVICWLVTMIPFPAQLAWLRWAVPLVLLVAVLIWLLPQLGVT